VDYARRAVGAGISKNDAVSTLTAMTARSPMDVGQEDRAPMVMKLNVNLHDYATAAAFTRGVIRADGMQRKVTAT
jgi:hypothetical protein